MSYPRRSAPPAAASFPAARSTALPRRRNLKTMATYLAAGTAIIFFLLWLLRGGNDASATSPNNHDVVVVTTIDPRFSKKHQEGIKENRRWYAQKHGYKTFFPNTTDYDLTAGVPASWSKLPALRHAMTLHPETPWLFFLSSEALIMNPTQNLHDKILNPRQLASQMIVEQPVVPPDSIIKTFKHLSPERVDFILTQDEEGLSGSSFLLRRGEWAKYFLDAWYDPLYRSYNFQKAENHALEHIVQWHGTVLAKLALVPQRLLNSYTKDTGVSKGLWQEGDFVATFRDCLRDPTRDCETEMAPYMTRWKELRDQERSR